MVTLSDGDAFEKFEASIGKSLAVKGDCNPDEPLFVFNVDESGEIAISTITERRP